MTDFSQVSHEDTVGEELNWGKLDPPEMVPGRVLHIDADFPAYMHGYRWETEALGKSIEMLEISLESLRIMAGADTAVLHLTMGDKGGRHEIAKVWQYQEQRSSRDEGLVERVGELRHHMAEMDTPTLKGFAQFKEEADDSLTQAMYAAFVERDPDKYNKAVIWSKDKDLDMVGGWHLVGDSLELIEYPWGYGSTKYDNKKKKAVGNGTSFFWHQLLMGDTADHIPGLPMLSRDCVFDFLDMPKYYTQAYNRTAKTNAQKVAKRKAIEAAENKIKAKKLGAATAVKILQSCKTDKQAFEVVKHCYESWYGHSYEFDSWDGEAQFLTSGDMLVEQARLLWMRRVPGEDVIEFFREVIQNG